jgi:hypothetical protein
MESSDPESGNADLEEKVEQLESKVDRLDQRTKGKNRIKIQAYDLRIEASSEETQMRDLLRMVSCEMESLTQRALVGEYQELEQEELHSILFGGD